MTKNQNEILMFLGKIKSCTPDQLMYFTNCTIQDINFLISNKMIEKDDKLGLIKHRTRKKYDVRTSVALDVIINIKAEIKDYSYSNKFPVIFTVITKENSTCDIFVVRNIEQESVFKKIEDYSNADKIIIVVDNDKYNKRLINTKKEVLICTYPIKIIDFVN